MMTKIKPISLLFLGILLSAFFVSSALADTETDQAKASAKTIKAELKKLKRLGKKSKIRKALANYSSSGLSDSDSDGLPDIFENALGSDSCDSDSDDDGISDDDEGHSGSDPHDSGSGEVEIKGLISAITDTTVTVDGNTFTVSANTEFENGTSLSSYHVGDRVEVAGRLINSVLTLKKIKIDD